MIQTKSLFVTRIALIVLVLMSAMADPGETGSRQFDEEQTARDPAGATELFMVEGAVDPSPLQLAKNGSGEEDRQELLELLEVLNEETEVATKTKMNNDYVPGMVTVLHGEQLEALGAHTVAEALAMVPGIQVARLSTGEPTVKVRGIAFPFNAGNVKVMLNSIALSRESSGINSSVLLTPLAQVDRIEVIRGPGSSIYGDFAMAGVVNILTKATGSRLFGLAGDDESHGGGGHYSYRDDMHDFGLGLNLSAMDEGENAADINRDAEAQRFTGVFNLTYKKFAFTAEGVRRKNEFQRLPPPAGSPPPPGTVPARSLREEDSWAVQGKQTMELGRSVTLDAYVSHLRNSFDADQPASEFLGDRLETRLDLNWSPRVDHQVLIGVSYADSDIDHAVQQRPGGASMTRVSGINRRNYALGLQDQIALSDRFSLTLGFRYDDYDDVGSLSTPRLAGVYRLGEHHVIKAQYSQGFRAPTFWELYGAGGTDESLDFEVMTTTELSYIYRRPKAVGRVTLYHSDIDDGIFQKPGGSFGNIVDIDARGVEVEWEQQLGEAFRWQANLSYNDTWDGRSTADDHQSPGIAAWLANLAFFVQPAAKYMLTGRWLHVGDRFAAQGLVGGYDTVDLTVSRMDLWKEGITLRVGAKNLLDDTVVYLTQLPDELSEREFYGRTWWLQLSYDF